MVRTQIQLTEEQSRALKKLAHERGISMAEIVRAAVEREIERDERKVKWDRALAFIGKFKDVDGATDVSVNHDFYLDQIYGEGLGRAEPDRE